MTMNFRTIKAGIVTLLGNAAAGQYRVRGYPDQNLSADEINETDRLVQVYYKSGQFPKSSGGHGPYDHRMVFRIELLASQAATCDLSVLNDPSATQGQLAAALAAAEPAAQGADDSLDELIDLIFQVLMSGPNVDLGMGFAISSRWVENIEKQEPFARGDRAVVSANMDLTCRILEAVTSATLTAAADVDVSHQHQGDLVTRAGVKVDVT